MAEVQGVRSVSQLLDFLHDQEFDLLGFDFFNQQAVKQLRFKSVVSEEQAQAILAELQVHQRLHRLHGRKPAGAEAGTAYEAAVHGLLSRGYSSAHHITTVTESVFASQNADLYGDDPEKARQVYRRAGQIKARVKHLAMNVKDLVASRYSRATLAHNADPELIDYFEGIPDYQSLFGSLDFCECEHCKSIFGPAAYFLDIMRITDRYITEPNSAKIPDGFKLADRRPDLFSRELTCDNTNRLIPFLQIVNEVLEAKLKLDLKKTDVLPLLATATYPFNLPAQIPLAQIRLALDRLNTPLWSVYNTLLEPQPDKLGFASLDVAREYLGLSPEEYALVTTPDPDKNGVSRSYGYDDISRHLPAGGPGTLTFTANTRLASGEGVDFTKVLSERQQIRAAGQVRTVLKVEPTTITVDVDWGDPGSAVPYTVFPVEDLSEVRTFEYRTASSLDDLQDLFVQGLSAQELRDGVADQLFINHTGEALPYLQISWSSGGDKENPVARIEGLSLARLDRVSRFVRLSRRLTIPFATLDWLMRATSNSEMTKEFILSLAAIRQLADKTGLSLEEIAAFLSTIKSIGRGNGEAPADLFDRTFNNPALLKGRNPYTIATPIPFDPSRPLAWHVGETADKPYASGTAQGGTAETITLAAGSKGCPGLSVTIKAGTGKGQQRVIRQYDAGTGIATIYGTWETLPDATSEYVVSNAPDLTGRLAAALQLRQADLDPVGARLQQILQSTEPLLLNLSNLTSLYRIARIPTLYRMTIDQYFTLLRLLYGATPRETAGLGMLQTIVSTCLWLNQSGLTVYELLYILTGERTRFLRPAFRNEDVPPFIATLAKEAKSTLLTADQLMAAGLDDAGAASAYAALVAQGFVGGSGVVLPNQERYQSAAAGFPVTQTSFAAAGIITEEESRAAFALLTLQHPPLILPTGDGKQGTLSSDFSDQMTLDFLFVADAKTDAKRKRVSDVLGAVRRQIRFTLFAPVVPVTSQAFRSEQIPAEQSQAVFQLLTGKGIVKADTGANFGSLSTDFNAQTPLDFLFVSQGAGQSRTIASYDGTTRVATLNAAWDTVPDRFSVYQVRAAQNAGTAQAGAADTVRLAADASDKNGTYNGMRIDLTAGTGAGQSRTITAYGGADRLATVDKPWETAPDNTTAYRVTSLVTQGTARGATATTITLAQDASAESDPYKDLQVEIVPDGQAGTKQDAVRAVLLQDQAHVAGVSQVMDATTAAQTEAAANGLAGFLRTTSPVVGALVPYAAASYTLLPYLPDLLLPPAGAEAPPSLLTLIDGLARASLMPSKLELTEAELRAIARRPEHFAIAAVDRLTLPDVQTLGSFKRFIREYQDGDDALLRFFDLPVAPDPKQQRFPSAKVDALATITGWESKQIEQLIPLLWPQEGQLGICTMQGLLRLEVPFATMATGGLDASFLQQMAALAPLSVGKPGQEPDPHAWARYRTVADAALSAVAGRFDETAFKEISDQLGRALEAVKRDGLVGYTIWHMQRTIRSIRQPDDLLQFLLIDVEMSGCDTTSYIAQGIGSVQLYMQRVRMGLEPGADTQDIRDIWWTWISSYRVWEANRKVFLYPENYIEPSRRRQASPEFRSLVEKLLQDPVTDENVEEAYMNYFDTFAVLANLVHVGGYHTERVERDRTTQTLYLVARTNTTPYKYYVRTLEKNSDCDLPTWGPWNEIKLTIKADYVTPVYAFDRLFLFWAEIAPTKSSTIVTNATTPTSSQAQSVASASLNYSFQKVTGDWVPAQVLVDSLPIKVQHNDFSVVAEEYVKVAFDNEQLFLRQPYAQSIARGIPGTGVLSLTEGFNVAKGTGTMLHRQVQPEDEIWVGGQRRRVRKIDESNQQLVIDGTWEVDATDVEFKVIPRDRDLTTFPPFTGTGRAGVTPGFNVVDGVGTNFEVEVRVGDGIQIEGETRTVLRIDPNQKLVVDGDWTIDPSVKGIGEVTVFDGLQNVSGKNTNFTEQLQPGDRITVKGITRTVHKVTSPTELLVTEGFTEDATDVAFTVSQSSLAYNIIPRTSGAERMLVVFGPYLEVGQAPDPDNTFEPEPNLGDDPFIASKNDFNLNLNAALSLTAKARDQHLSGNVTGAVAMVLSDDLTQQSLRVLVTDYNQQAIPASPPIQPRLTRENDLLQVTPSRNLLYSTYWASDAPGTRLQPGLTTANARDLLYHVDGQQASIYGIGNQIGWYLFNNVDQAYLVQSVLPNTSFMNEMAFVRHYSQPGSRGNMRVDFGPYTTKNIPYDGLKFRYTRLTTNAVQPLKQRLFAGGIPRLLTLEAQQLPELPFTDFYRLPNGAPPPTLDTDHIPPARMDFNGSFGPYFQEIFLHAPLLIADQLKTNQRFEDAKRWYEYIFNPTGKPTPDDKHPNDRYWRYLPFRSMTIPKLIDILTNQCEIDAYNDDPFDPDAIARLRISAYAKAVVMKYVDNLLQWGDALFTQDTREAIGQAAGLYILARDLLGKRPESTGPCPTRAALDFNQIKTAYPDGIPQFLIRLENTPFVRGCPDSVRLADVPFNDIDSYFCIPENEEFVAYWDRVEDRLFKIRHCMNIKGIERPLALFAPPLDPRALIQSFAAGGGALGAAAPGATPVPAYRFTYLVAQARSLVSDVMQLGSSLLAALERRDAEQLEMLRVTQAAKLLNLLTTIKEQQIAEIDAQGDSLQQSLAGATERKQHYDQLITAGLLPEEVAQIVSLGLAGIFNVIGTGLKTAAAIGYAVPQAGSPFAMTYGGEQLGASLQEAAGAMEALAIGANVVSQLTSIAASNKRREQEWTFQKKLAEIDVAMFNAQIAANLIRKTIAQRDLEMHNTQIAQNEQMGQFLQRKFTSAELYNWMVDRIASVYFQAYSAAIDMARLAQRAYQFEYGTDATFITFGYWDSLHKGLTAGSGLLLAVGQMEKTYVQQATRPLEIQRTISLRQLNPLAFLRFVQAGECIFELPERLFDADFPGHYNRRIKTLSVSIPAVVGPYQNIKATLTQTGNQIVLQPKADVVRFLLGDATAPTPTADQLQTGVRNNQQIALSSAQHDTGLFSVDLNDSRYLPFEGTGAVSAWRLSMPPANNQIAFSSIADVVIQLQYTAVDGGRAFQQQVASLPELSSRSWSRLTLAAKQDPTAWYAFLHEPPVGEVQTLRLPVPALTLPNVTGSEITGFYFKLQTAPGVSTASRNAYITVQIGSGDPVTVSLASSGDFLFMFPSPIPAQNTPPEVRVSFNLASGFTPAGLKQKGGDNALNPEAFVDIDLVWFLQGSV